MLDYQGLAAVAAVVREGTFERAAAALGVTPSAVSQRVRGIEERLGAVLIVRGQHCMPTSVGTRVCAHIEHVRLLESEIAESLPSLANLGGHMQKGTTIRVAVNADSLGTWFMPAAAAFSRATGALLDILVDDEEQTAGHLRSGDVLAAVTANPSPVQGCRIIPIGALRYLATASPDFADRYFRDGIAAESIVQAPVLRFGRDDHLQARWVRDVLGVDFAAPTHFVPTAQGFLHATLTGLGWGMNPQRLVKDHLQSGRLVDLAPGRCLHVRLYWQHARLGAKLLTLLTREVQDAARRGLIPDK
jgi:LysR family transcriptional regulator (chromosome initiation inhibitor)